MSVTLYPAEGRTASAMVHRGVSGKKAIQEYLTKSTRSLVSPIQLKGHKDHILEVLKENADLHVSITHSGISLYAFCVKATKESKRKLRVGGLKTSGASAVVALAGLVEWAALGKYMSLYVTDDPNEARTWGVENPATFGRSVTFKDLEVVVRAF